ncbi:MAG TPA: hypothetical protein VM076_00955 [Gemmatimonadaceae bacterium]|nr:hypothetical protein [Gemmatimonadaceae bacterium]
MPTKTPTAIHLATAVAVGALLWSCAGYVPMWDGFLYASAINDAAHSPSLAGLRLAGHASHVYAAVAIAFQSLALDRYWPTLLLGALLVALAAVAFNRLLRLVFPGDERALDRALLTGAFAVQPTLLAAAVQPGLDLPLVPAFLWCVVLLMEGRRVALVVVGTAIAFTKETGVLLYAALLASYGLWTLLRTPGPVRDRALAVVRLAPLALPGIIFCLYLLVRRQLIPAGEPVVWSAGTAMINQSLLRQLLVPRIDRYLASYLSMLAVLNFAWVITVVVTAAVLVVVKRLGINRLLDATRQLVPTPLGFVVLLLLVTTYLLTRFASYANSRYLLPVMALLLVPFFAALVSVGIGATVRRAFVAGLSLLLIVSNVRTVDPISRELYRTFVFGDYSMLRLNSITHECCASGRDQLVYSVEFTELERLMSDALAAFAPGDSTLIVLPDSTNWYAAEVLDRTTHRRSFARVNVYQPTVVESDSASLYAAKFERGVYLALPNGNGARGLTLLEQSFAVGPERRFVRGGHVLSAYALSARRP